MCLTGAQTKTELMAPLHLGIKAPNPFHQSCMSNIRSEAATNVNIFVCNNAGR